jgi:hypothetical protein
MTTDTARTDAVPSTQSMLTAQSDPVKLYQQLCKVTVDFGKALDACVEYRKEINASKSEVERLSKLTEDCLNVIRVYCPTYYNDAMERFNKASK